MSVTLAMAIISALVTDFPEIVADVKALIALIEGKPPPATGPSLGSQVTLDTQALENKLEQAK